MIKSATNNLLLPTESSFDDAIKLYYHRFKVFMMVVGANLIIGLSLVFSVTNWYIFWTYLILLVMGVAIVIFLMRNRIEDNVRAEFSYRLEDMKSSNRMPDKDDLEKLINLTDQITIIRQELEEMQSNKQTMERQKEYEALKYEIHLLTDCLTTS